MSNPFFDNAISGVRYALFWAVLTVVHVLVLIGNYQVSVFPAVMDALVFNILFSVLAPSLWFVVQFSPKDFLGLASTLLAACMVTVGVWLWLSSGLLSFIFADSLHYILFLDESMFARGIQGVFFYAVCILVFYVIFYLKKYKEKIEQEGRVQQLLKEAELERLKAQINPHFIFNSLNSVNVLTMVNPEQAQEMVILLSDFLRHSLGQNIQEETSLEKEMENVSRYLAIEKVRFGKVLEFESEFGEELKECRLPNMLLQPLAENAVKYGVYESTDPVSIRIGARKEGEFLSLRIQNTFDPEAKPRKGKGIGLKNLRERLRLIYGRDDLLRIQKYERRFVVDLLIPQSKEIVHEAH
ncbi:MAG: histidine kinase [Cytophagales bacterium]|nr:histidine kinase [Cytophagales bacterium]